MLKEITWLGHNCWLLKLGKTALMIDPFFCNAEVKELADQTVPHYLLVSHGHGDHCAGALETAKRANSTVIAIAEVTSWFESHGIRTIEPMNIGGGILITVEDESGQKREVRVTMTPALHSSTMPDAQSGGNSCGFLLSIPQKESFPREILPLSQKLKECSNIYFACDTGYFSEMKYLGQLGLEVAVLPIGDRYTLGPEMSLDALRTLRSDYVIPAHYNTWRPIAVPEKEWQIAVERYTVSRPIVLELGESFAWEQMEEEQ